MIPTFAANIISLKASLVRMCFGSPFLMLHPSDYDNTSVFPHLRTLPALDYLYLKFHNKILRDEDLAHLTPLEQHGSLGLKQSSSILR
ncbi:hypothetical protein KCU93_g4911, partial [Aureobasidium melanogenum]